MKETASTIVGYDTSIADLGMEGAMYLNNLLAWKDTPCNGIRALGMGVGPQIALLVYGIVGDSGITLNPTDQGR